MTTHTSLVFFSLTFTRRPNMRIVHKDVNVSNITVKMND